LDSPDKSIEKTQSYSIDYKILTKINKYFLKFKFKH
jgi:hypothetical protein